MPIPSDGGSRDKARQPSVPLNELALSRVGFGCASLMRLATARQRRNLLAAALGSGLTHFDVARMYGLGAVEGEVGPFLSRRPETTTIATKFGIEVSGALQRVGRLQGPARALLNRAPRVRAVLHRQQSSFHQPRRYDAGIARRSLDTSLGELHLDHVDILFIHDPHPTDDLRLGEILQFLKEARSAGKIRSWGVSQDAFPDFELADRLGPQAVLQLRHDALDGHVLPPGAIAFGALGAAHNRIIHWLQQDPARRKAWHANLDADPVSGNVLPSLLLARVLTESPDRVLLFSTTKIERLSIPRRLLDSPLPTDQLARFEALLARDGGAIRALTA